MTYLRVRNFSELQHYTDRPDNPWIKFYVRVLDDEELNALPVPTRLLWTQLLLLAQRFGNVVPNDPERLAGLTAIDPSSVSEGIKQLLAGSWLTETSSPRRASKPASKRASTRARAEEAEAEVEQKPLPREVFCSSTRSDETAAAAPALNGRAALDTPETDDIPIPTTRSTPTFPCSQCAQTFTDWDARVTHLALDHPPVEAL